ncbi:MAG TPA: DUF4013 domain-containing protein [Thermoanaerobaculia bacterium]|nr:DUF4013 domain-containing protein [Thermoanaerobaculia bacterium]
MSELPLTPPPPPPPPPAAPAPLARFDFAAPFTYVFEDPRWLQKVLIGGLFYLAGFMLIGWVFLLGYMARVTRNVIAGNPRPLPEWDDLGDYFSEGLRLFGVLFIFVLPVIVVAIFLGIPAALLSAVEREGVQTVGGIFAGCMSCLIVPIALAVTFIVPASLLFAVVEQRFGAAFEFGRIWSFIKLNIGNYLLAIVIYFIARFLGGFGVILFCIGVIFTGFWSLLITSHAFGQVYRFRRA